MPISSMTGFARLEGSWGAHRWTWELKSVNSKGLDIRYRLPSGLDAHDSSVKKTVASHLARGNVNCNLSISSEDKPVQIQVNRHALESAVQAAILAAEEHGLEAPKIADLMALRGVIEVVEDAMDENEREGRDQAVLASLKDAVDELATDRQQEGARLAAFISGQIDNIEVLLVEARKNVEGQAQAILERLANQFREAMAQTGVELDQSRVVHEASILALKADITEELDRLEAHIEAARLLLSTSGPIGRKFDFLAQEFGREANTLASKAADNALSAIGLEFKVVIDQIREQVQNIE